MKKLMIAAAAALSATVGFSIESANVVGFHGMGFGSDTWSMSGNTFLPVGSASFKLGQITPTAKSGAISTSNFYLMMVGTDGNPRYVKDDTQIAALPNGSDIVSKYGSSPMQLVWVTAKNSWYLSADSSSKNRKYPLTDYVIPAGEGFLVRCTDSLPEGVSFTYSGEVAKLGLPVEADTDTWQISANVAPADITLGNVVVTVKSGTISTSNFYLMMVGTDGNPRYVKDDAQIAALPNGSDIVSKYGSSPMQLVWVTAKNAWYLSADSSSKNRKYPLTDYVIPAGAGFLIRVTDSLADGVTVTMPSALEN